MTTTTEIDMTASAGSRATVVAASMAPLRFTVPSEHALLTLADASGGLSALFALDAHIAHHLKWFEEAAMAFGRVPEEEDDETKDARASANARLEPIRALRTELAELAADAESQLPEGQEWNVEIVAEHPLAYLPDTLGPRELLKVERSFHNGVATQLLAATQSLGPLADRLGTFDDEESRGLAARIRGFLASSGLGQP
jgi:hypothetical protein